MSHKAQKMNTVVMEIPVCYGCENGPDLDFVAKYNHLTPEEVVRLHTSAEYLIYMLGFTPGFSYMGGMDERIATGHYFALAFNRFRQLLARPELLENKAPAEVKEPATV